MADKEYVKNFLKDNSQGLSIQELADKTKLSRQQVVVLLAELKGEKKILVREIGQVKLNYWKWKKN